MHNNNNGNQNKPFNKNNGCNGDCPTDKMGKHQHGEKSHNQNQNTPKQHPFNDKRNDNMPKDKGARDEEKNEYGQKKHNHNK